MKSKNIQTFEYDEVTLLLETLTYFVKKNQELLSIIKESGIKLIGE